jgi:hypothetical protein
MRTAKKFKTVKLLAGAMAMTSLLAAAPVQAAEAEKDLRSAVVTNTVTNMAAAGYVSGLEASLVKQNTNTELNVVTSALKTGFVTVEDKTYYYDTFGQKVVGSHLVDGEEYYFNEEGEMQTGLIREEDNAYFYNEEDGTKETGLVEYEGNTYYLTDEDTLYTGWKEVDGQKRYFNTDGTMRTNSMAEVDGNMYLFDGQGNLTKNTTTNGYVFDENGVGTPDLTGYDRIYQAAMAQLGVYQDCTMLVTNSLAAVGINFHGWPIEYLSLGTITSNPVPGDIIVYEGHVAIYAGDGMAVHGGWNGNQTVLYSVECNNAFIAYVHPTLPN